MANLNSFLLAIYLMPAILIDNSLQYHNGYMVHHKLDPALIFQIVSQCLSFEMIDCQQIDGICDLISTTRLLSLVDRLHQLGLA